MRTLISLGQLAAAGRQNALAISQYEPALEIANKLGDRVAQARLHGRIGQLKQENRDTLGALDHFRYAVDAAETLDDPAMLERSLMALATAQHAVGESGAMSTYRRVLAMVRDSNRPEREAMIHYNMGLLVADEGDTATGLKHLYRASDLLADADLLDTDLADRIEDAIVDNGGRTLARSIRRQTHETGYEDDEPDERDPDNRWGGYEDELPYPPDELDSRVHPPAGLNTSGCHKISAIPGVA